MYMNTPSSLSYLCDDSPGFCGPQLSLPVRSFSHPASLPQTHPLVSSTTPPLGLSEDGSGPPGFDIALTAQHCSRYAAVTGIGEGTLGVIRVVIGVGIV